jgi:hypothetical protein
MHKNCHFDDTDYSVVMKNRGAPSEPVEVGDLSRQDMVPDRAVSDFFRTMTAATKAGKAALKQLLAELNA